MEVELIDADGGWGPYLSLEEVHKLDRVRIALRRGELASVVKLERVYRLTPVMVVRGVRRAGLWVASTFAASVICVWCASSLEADRTCLAKTGHFLSCG